MTHFRTALALGLALFALGIPASASADTDVGSARALAATLDSTATLRTLAACHGTPACRLTAARKLQTQVRAMAAAVLLHNSQLQCNLFAFERAYGPTQNALAAWAGRPDAIHTRSAMGALQSWYAAMDATKICAS